MRGNLLLLITLISFHSFESYAQGNLYVNLQGGPRLSFSQNFNPNNFLSTNQKWSNAYGFRAGYTLPIRGITLETGLTRYFTETVIDIEEYGRPKNKRAFIYTSAAAWQIPLTFKARILRISEKFEMKALVGAALSIRSNKWNLEGDAENIIFRNPEISFSRNSSSGYYVLNYVAYQRKGTQSSNWLIESGLEFGYNLSSRFSLNIGGKFQYGLQAAEGIIVYRLTPEDRNPTKLITAATSQGSGLLLNGGITYSFGKIKPVE